MSEVKTFARPLGIHCGKAASDVLHRVTHHLGTLATHCRTIQEAAVLTDAHPVIVISPFVKADPDEESPRDTPEAWLEFIASQLERQILVIVVNPPPYLPEMKEHRLLVVVDYYKDWETQLDEFIHRNLFGTEPPQDEPLSYFWARRHPKPLTAVDRQRAGLYNHNPTGHYVQAPPP